MLSGGAAGAVSRITGTLGKGIAALTMDDKYKQERRQAMGKKPVNVKEGLTRGGKGLLEVKLLSKVVISKFAFNIVLFVYYCITVTDSEGSATDSEGSANQSILYRD